MDMSLLVGLGGHSLLLADGSSSVSPFSALIGKQLCDCATLSGGDGTYESKNDLVLMRTICHGVGGREETAAGQSSEQSEKCGELIRSHFQSVHCHLVITE